VKTTDIVLPNGTVIPDSNPVTGRERIDDRPARPAAAQIPGVIQVAFTVSLLLLAGGAGYRLGDAVDPGQPWLADPLVSWSPVAVWAGITGIVACAVIELNRRLTGGRR
jgi:hypothetical protein